MAFLSGPWMYLNIVGGCTSKGEVVVVVVVVVAIVVAVSQHCGTLKRVAVVDVHEV